MWVIIEFLTKESINLHTIEIKLMGLQLSALFLAPFSNISETYVIFQSCGIYSSSMVFFRRRAKGLVQDLLTLLKFVDAFCQVRMIYLNSVSIFRSGPVLLQYLY